VLMPMIGVLDARAGNGVCDLAGWHAGTPQLLPIPSGSSA
jgi:hypothetical protein